MSTKRKQAILLSIAALLLALAGASQAAVVYVFRLGKGAQFVAQPSNPVPATFPGVWVESSSGRLKFTAADGTVQTLGVHRDTLANRPTCDATARGQLFVVASSAGTADEIDVCLKSAADAYSWRTIVGG